MIIKPLKALNKAYVKMNTKRAGIELFKQNLILLLDSIKEKESEEFHKNLISDFLKNTYYSPNHFINTKGRNDLVIHTGKEAKSNVGVIIEAKSPSNKAEMPSQKNLNSKALQELVLYFLRERITHKNLELKNLVVTNVNEWFIFDAQLFDKLFAQDKNLVKQFEEFEAGKLSGKNTDFFYKEIAKINIESKLDKLEYTYFDLASYALIVRNSNQQDDNQLIVLYKLLSPEHLMKLSFANDSNSLDKNFYNELLHLIGLTETKEGGKKLIERQKAGHRHAGSLLENVINQLDSLDKLSRLPNVNQYGDTYEERLFAVGLELCITWVNRILFLKLLEAQLISYSKRDNSFAFLHKGLLHDYDNLNALFFMVLAKKPEERNDRVKNMFAKVPYLNSSLFEPTELEHQTLFISGLEDDIQLPFLSATVIKDANGKKLTGSCNAIDYFFDFLDAYDFASEGNEDIQEDNKTLINASVLGLIFEKINGYKDGSFYTPSFITMYMCKETIRRAVVQKFNETKGWNCADFLELQNKDFTLQEANAIINSVKICDPAVGSGHFLVSALNEMIAIKHDLKVLVDRAGKRLKEYQVDIVNDELIVTDEDGVPFAYTIKNKESQRVQETLFHEKQTIIENCLFGVDINPNSVKICRLRLWIELLKNSYYHNETELETLPNIDINIKCGNSLISRFGLDADLKEALQKSKLKIDDYKRAVDQYRNAESKAQKREMEVLIEQIKSSFRNDFNTNDPKLAKLYKLKGELTVLNSQTDLFGLSKKEESARNKQAKELTSELQKLESEIEALKNNKIYENAFEWRFEFPEVLNDQGDFVGFDVVIGNPPYIQLQAIKDVSDYLKKFNFKTFEKTGDLYSLFYEKGNEIIRQNGFLGYITSNKWMRAGYGKSTRNYFLKYTQPLLLIDLGSGIFEEASVDSNILINQKTNYGEEFDALDISKEKKVKNLYSFYDKILRISPQLDESWTISSIIDNNIKKKIENQGKALKKWNVKLFRGITTGYNEAFIIDSNKKDELIAKDPKCLEIIKPILRGRDIKRYKVDFSDLWLINSHNGVKEKNIPRIDLEKNYPVIYSHLQQYKTQLIQRQDKGDHWSNLRNCSYLNDFNNEKIIFSKASQQKSFAFDFGNRFLQNTSYFICGDNLKYLIAFLNSKFINFAFLKFYQGGGIEGEITLQAIENIPLIEIPIPDQQPFIDKVEQILSLKKDNPEANTSVLEREIDEMVYALYGLSDEEIAIVEGS
jgi:type II restriction/modification system DNA methylase subunit YeeA